MSANYTYNPAGGIAEKTKSQLKVEKGIKKMLIIAGIALAAELIWLFGISPFIPFTTIEVHGISELERAEILRLAGVNEHSSFITLDTVNAQKQLASHYLLESAGINKRFPDRLTIFVKGRTAAAVSLVSYGSGMIPLYIDRHGVVFKMGKPAAMDTNLPILSGIDFKSILDNRSPEALLLGMRLEAEYIPMLESLFKIASDSPELLSAISEIRIEQKALDGFDLIVYPVSGSVRVRLESRLTEDILRYTLLMLAVLERHSPNSEAAAELNLRHMWFDKNTRPDEIDFRSGMGAYKMKEPLW